MRSLLRLVAALHARGFHPAVVAGLIMMPAVVAVGIATDRPLHGGGPGAPGASTAKLRGSLFDGATARVTDPVAF